MDDDDWTPTDADEPVEEPPPDPGVDHGSPPLPRLAEAAAQGAGHGPSLPWDRTAQEWQAYRLPLGSADGEVVWSQPFPTVVIAQGQPGSGKSTGYVGPAMASWPGPALCVSARYDMADLTRASRARRGTTWIFDPAGLHPGADRYDLFGEVTDYGRAQEVAADLVAPMSTRGVLDEVFWRTKARQYLGVLVFAAAQLPDRSEALGRLLSWVKTTEEYEVRCVLAGLGGDEAVQAMEDAESFWGLEQRTLSGVVVSADAALEPYRRPAVAAAIGPGVTAAQLLAGDHTLYVCAPPTGQRELAPVLTTVINRVLRAAGELNGRTGRPSRLLTAVDEAGNVAGLGDLPALTTTAGGAGMAVLAAFHSPSQMRRVHGPDGAEEIVENASEVVFLAGRSPSAAALLDDYAGVDVEGLPVETGVRRLRRIRSGSAVVFPREGEARLVRVLAHWRDPELGWDLGV